MLRNTAVPSALLLAALLTLVPSSPPSPPSPPGAEGIEILSDDTQYIVRVDPDEGGRLTEFLRLSQTLLGQPIKYSPAEVADVRLRFAGDLTCAREDFPGLFESVMRSYQFVVATRSHDGGAFLEVLRLTNGGPPGSGRLSWAHTVLLQPEELETPPAILMPFYTVVFPVKNTDARGMMASLQSMIDTTMESIRNVDSHALIVTASLDHLRFMGKLIAAMDETAEDRVGQIQELQQKVAALEARLNRLETPSPAGR